MCDNAANMVAGIEQCGLPSIGCAIHTLQLVIKDCILLNALFLTCWQDAGKLWATINIHI